MDNMHTKNDLLPVTLAVAMAEVDVLMMLLFNNYDLSGTQLVALIHRRLESWGVVTVRVTG